MKLSPNTVRLFVFLIAGMFAWNLFLIHRDRVMFEGYNMRQAELEYRE